MFVYGGILLYFPRKPSISGKTKKPRMLVVVREV
jgi:hypothetical protein